VLKRVGQPEQDIVLFAALKPRCTMRRKWSTASGRMEITGIYGRV